MPYPAVPDRRMPYDNDGTVLYYFGMTVGAYQLMAGADAIEMQDADFTSVGVPAPLPLRGGVVLFFPEAREVTAYYSWAGFGDGNRAFPVVEGSSDTTNGLDGTWETASLPSGVPTFANNFSWRESIKPISFTGGKETVRFRDTSTINSYQQTYSFHVYGEKVAGETIHDLVFIDHDTTPGVEYTAVEDFGDRPLGTTVVRQFRVKNTSATRTAEDVNIQLNDADFALADNPAGPWVVTLNIASLAPGAESATFYIRNTTPAPGNPLGPRFGRIVVIAEQAGVPGSNFFAP